MSDPKKEFVFPDNNAIEGGSATVESEEISELDLLENQIKITDEELEKMITMSNQLRNNILNGDFVKKLKAAQKEGNDAMVEALKTDAIEQLEGAITFMEMMNEETGLAMALKKLKLTMEHITEQFE